MLARSVTPIEQLPRVASAIALLEVVDRCAGKRGYRVHPVRESDQALTVQSSYLV